MAARRILSALCLCTLVSFAWPADEPAAKAPPDLQVSERADLLAQVKQHSAKKEWDQALAKLDKVLTIDRAKSGAVSEPTAETLTSIAECQERKGDWPAAVTSRTEVTKLWEQLKGKEHWQTGEARVRADDASRMEKRTPDQRKAWREAWEAYAQAYALSADGKFQVALTMAKYAET